MTEAMGVRSKYGTEYVCSKVKVPIFSHINYLLCQLLHAFQSCSATGCVQELYKDPASSKSFQSTVHLFKHHT